MHMNEVAKIVIINKVGNYLMLRRNNHPVFGDDVDIPGGCVEPGESALQALLREVNEELGIDLPTNKIHEIYASNRYSNAGKRFILFSAKLHNEPKLVLSWEHSYYRWLTKAEFIYSADKAEDSFMHMVAHAIKQQA